MMLGLISQSMDMSCVMLSAILCCKTGVAELMRTALHVPRAARLSSPNCPLSADCNQDGNSAQETGVILVRVPNKWSAGRAWLCCCKEPSPEYQVCCCRQMDTHKQGMMEAQQAHTDAARRQKEIDAQANKLGSHLDKAKAHANQMDTTTAKHSDSESPSSLFLFHGYPS